MCENGDVSRKTYGDQTVFAHRIETRDWPSNMTRITEEESRRDRDRDRLRQPLVAMHVFRYRKGDRCFTTRRAEVLHRRYAAEDVTVKARRGLCRSASPGLPIGMSRFGFFASCAAVETASKPI